MNPGLVRIVLSVIVILVEHLVLFHVLPLISLEVSDVFTALLLSYSHGCHSWVPILKGAFANAFSTALFLRLFVKLQL